MATSLTLRSVKGSQLTISEVDANFTALQSTADRAVSAASTAQTTANNAATAAGAAQTTANGAAVAAAAAQSTANSATTTMTNLTNANFAPAVPGAYLQVISTNSVSTSPGNNTPVKSNEILCTRAGTYTVGLSCSTINGTGAARIYKNGVAFGTQRSFSGGLTVYEENLAFVYGDLIQLYIWTNGGLSSSITSGSLYLKVNNPIGPSVVTL